MADASRNVQQSESKFGPLPEPTAEEMAELRKDMSRDFTDEEMDKFLACVHISDIALTQHSCCLISSSWHEPKDDSIGHMISQEPCIFLKEDEIESKRLYLIEEGLNFGGLFATLLY